MGPSFRPENAVVITYGKPKFLCCKQNCSAVTALIFHHKDSPPDLQAEQCLGIAIAIIRKEHKREVGDSLNQIFFKKTLDSCVTQGFIATNKKSNSVDF